MSGGLTTIKLGGSFARSPLLSGWLDLFVREAGRVVVVAGGGPFADAVRDAQTSMKFDDAAAHDTALMAMAQFARSLVSFHAAFDYADTLASVRESVAASRVPMWAPWPMLRGASDIPTSWHVTSDSLAVWLSAKLQADRLVIAKQWETDLALPDDLLDAAFPTFRECFGGEVLIAGPAAPRSLRDVDRFITVPLQA